MRVFTVFPWEGGNGRGRVRSLELASLSSFSGLWVWRAAGGLYVALGWLGAGGQWPSVSLITEVLGWALDGLHLRVPFEEE